MLMVFVNVTELAVEAGLPLHEALVGEGWGSDGGDLGRLEKKPVTSVNGEVSTLSGITPATLDYTSLDNELGWKDNKKSPIVDF